MTPPQSSSELLLTVASSSYIALRAKLTWSRTPQDEPPCSFTFTQKSVFSGICISLCCLRYDGGVGSPLRAGSLNARPELEQGSCTVVRGQGIKAGWTTARRPHRFWHGRGRSGSVQKLLSEVYRESRPATNPLLEGRSGLASHLSYKRPPSRWTCGYT